MSDKIPHHFIDELLVRVDIVDIVSERLALKKAGREYIACCPFHTERTPSFTVSPIKQFYHCFGCQAHGSAIGFLMAYEHMDFVEAVEALALRVGMQVPRETSPRGQRGLDDLYEVLEQAAHLYQRWLFDHPEAPRARAYLKKRGLSEETLRQFGLGFAPPGWDNLRRALGSSDSRRAFMMKAGLLVPKETAPRDGYDRFRDRIIFPLRDRRGRVIAFGARVLDDGTPKYLNSPETPIFHKGQQLYGFYEALKVQRLPKQLLVVEGYMDVVALAEHGVHTSVATLGTATTSEHLERLFRTVTDVVFCFDGDRAGREAAWRALKIALPFMRQGWQAKFLFLPEGEDPDSLLRTQGRPAFDDLLRQAVPLSVFFFDKLAGEIDTHHLDGRARLVERAKPLLAKLPDSVFRHMMLTRLGEFSGVEPERLSMLIDKRPAATPARGISLSKTQRLARPPVRVVVALLLERPDLVRHVGNPERFAGLELPGVALLVRLAKLLGANPDLNIGALLERWRDTKDGEHLVRVARWNHGVPREDMEKEFIDTLCYLGKKLKEQRWEYLEMKLRKDGWGALTEVERQEWRRLPIELQRSRPSGN